MGPTALDPASGVQEGAAAGRGQSEPLDSIAERVKAVEVVAALCSGGCPATALCKARPLTPGEKPWVAGGREAGVHTSRSGPVK